MNIHITENKEEKIAIGKSIFEEKTNIYTDNIVKTIRDTIDRLHTDNVSLTKEEMFFLSIYDYWAYGNDIGEEYYLGYWNKTHEEKLEYTNLRMKTIYVNHLNKKEDAHILNDKYEAYETFKEFYMRDVIKIEAEKDFLKFCDFVEKHPIFVAKPTGAGLAIGVHKVDVKDYPNIKNLFEELLNEGRACESRYAWCAVSSMVLEELIDQVDELKNIHPYSVNGIRVSTLRQENGVKILYPWFKVGSNKGFVTSAAYGTFDAGIDSDTGVVNTHGYLEDGSFCEYHPVTGIKFIGYQIPKWHELIETVKKLAMVLPNITYVGWDMVLTPKGWCVMEGNYAGDFMWQMFLQRGFRKELEEIIGWHFDKHYWWER